MTIKLYYEDVYRKNFKASVLETAVDAEGTPYAVLDQTAFYPTGGGQPCDWGTLSGIPVINVEEADGKILHKLERALPADLIQVDGEINWQRRFDHMQQHSGQHLLSATFETLYDAETFGFHMGQEVVTVDIMRHPILPEEITAVEAMVNQIIFENRPITAKFVEPEDLQTLPLRKPPSVSENIRIVTVADFDYSPCGGTHPGQTGEIGLVKVLSWEKHKAGSRVEFVCGWRTIRSLDKKQNILRELGKLLGTGEADLAASIAKQLEDRKESERKLQEALQTLMEHEADDLREHAQKIGDFRVSIGVFQNRSMQELQRLTSMITSHSNRISLLASVGEKTNLVFARTSDLTISMFDLLKAVLPMIDGKGGGNPAVAQGGGNATGSPQFLLEEAVRILRKQTQPANLS